MRITMGVTGGVAAYKAAEMVRLLQQDDFTVEVVMTRAAREFITPLTFAALTGQKVITDLFGSEAKEANLDSAIEHIAVAQRTDLLLVVPATADIIAKFARGIADDFLRTLRERGVTVVEPDEGYLACGMTGAGRLAGHENIVAAVKKVLNIKQDLAGETVLVTAGPTCEDLDPVRYITNRSSGKMGYAIAQAAARRGANAILVSGPTALTTTGPVRRIDVRTAEEMHAAVKDQFSSCSIGVFAAAVADYRPTKTHSRKMKKSSESLTIALEPTTDILASVARDKGDRIIVGFAAETDDISQNARKKLAAKNVDLIVANDVTATGAGFDHDTNVVSLFSRDGKEATLPKLSKAEVAQKILDEVVRLRSAERTKRATRLSAV
jgi:phosphopantothenoylcysteine decarboxylase / phosphopantothenate---cysteine ligase